jgi:hypothetical protein
MKKYSLILLEERHEIGEVDVSNHFKDLSIKLNEEGEKYTTSFTKLINNLNAEGNFKVKYYNYVVNNSSAEFWVALKQVLMLEMDILIVEKDK